MLTLGWALAGLIGALAGVLVSPDHVPLPGQHGLDLRARLHRRGDRRARQPGRRVVGGLILGVALNYVGGYLGSNLVPIFGLAALIVILMIRPSGLFSASTSRQV